MEGYVKFTKDRDNNQSEKARLAYQHEVILDAMGHRAVLAPVDLTGTRSLRILDSGAANGRWLLDLRRSLERDDDAGPGPGGVRHEYVGTDVDASLYPPAPPPGVSFVDQSIRAPFPAAWRGTFDLVHQRLVMAAASPPQTTVASVTAALAGLLRPGGWLQLVELDNECAASNGPALRRLLRYHQQNSAAGGLGPNISVHLVGAMREAGLRDVEMRAVEVYYGALNGGGEELRAKSTRSLLDVVGPVLAQAKGTYHGRLECSCCMCDFGYWTDLIFEKQWRLQTSMTRRTRIHYGHKWRKSWRNRVACSNSSWLMVKRYKGLGVESCFSKKHGMQ